MDSCHGLQAPDQREGIVETSVQEDEIAFNPEIPSSQEDLGQPRRLPAGSPLFCSMRSGTLILEFTFCSCFSERGRERKGRRKEGEGKTESRKKD